MNSPQDGGQRYHHGDLRRALLDAAEEEIEIQGIEGFSLRKVAKRAGVSHAAPAHHFGSADGLLTALAAHGFRVFLDTMKERQKDFAPDGRSQIKGAGIGYIDFAERHNALFRLVFSSIRPDHDDEDLDAAAFDAFNHLVNCVAAITGKNAFEDEESMTHALALWSMAHGFADLMSSQRMKPLTELPENELRVQLESMFERVLPPVQKT